MRNRKRELGRIDSGLVKRSGNLQFTCQPSPSVHNVQQDVRLVSWKRARERERAGGEIQGDRERELERKRVRKKES